MNLFTIWYLLQKNSLHFRKIPDKDLLLTVYISRFFYLINFYDTSTALREQIYYKAIYMYYNFIVHNGWTIPPESN